MTITQRRLIVERSDGPPWIARVFSSLADQFERVEADAEVLRWLEAVSFPAERVAHATPVSSLDGNGVMVTRFVPGGTIEGTVADQRVLGELLGRLHALPPGGGAASRDGGAFDHDPSYVGRPSADLGAALNFLRTVEDAVSKEGRSKFAWLLEQVESADDCEGLPDAFTHGNFGAFNVVAGDNGPVVVGWAASGLAPRLASLGWLLYCSGGNRAHVEQIVRGYSQHVLLSDDELARLHGAIMLRDLYLGSWYYWMSVSSGYTPTGAEGWWPSPTYWEPVAAHAVSVFEGLR